MMKLSILMLFSMFIFVIAEIDYTNEATRLSQVSLKKHFHGSKGKKLGVSIEKPAKKESKKTMEKVLRSIAYTDDEIAEVVNDKNFKKSDPEAYYERIKVLWKKRQQVLRDTEDAVLDEFELMKEWLETLETCDAEMSIEILTHLEDHLTDLDKVPDFLAADGLQKLKAFLKNRLIFSKEENEEILKKLFLTLGTGAKYNLFVQKQILELDLLLDAKQYFRNCQASLCNKILYFVGAATRGSEDNLIALRELNMFDLFFERMKECSFDNSRDLKLAKRVTDIALDVTNEREDDDLWMTIGVRKSSIPEFCDMFRVLHKDILEAAETCSQDREVNIFKVMSNFEAILSKCA